MKTKILIIQEFFPPDVIGGGEKLFLKAAKLLIEKGYEVKILCTGNPSEKYYDGIRTVRYRINRYLMGLCLPEILRHSMEADLIQTSSGNAAFPSWLTGKILNKPVVCYVHHIAGDNWKDIRGFFIGSIFQSIERFFLTRSYDAMIFQNRCSEEIGKELGISPSKIHMIAPGIDCKEFDGNTRKERFVLFVGSLNMTKEIVKTKGLDYLIHTARLLPEIRFVVVGGGEYMKKLKKESPKNVMFTGPLTRKPLTNLFKKAGMFCLPSLSEGFGITILEAMASGCAIISTIDIGQKGFLIKPKSVGSIIRGIRFYCDNPKIASQHGKMNKQLARRFTWKRFIRNIIHLHDELIKYGKTKDEIAWEARMSE